MLLNLKDIFCFPICCVTLSKNMYMAMKKENQNSSIDKRKMSKLERENAKLKAQNENLKADNKQLRSALAKEGKKKDVKVIELNSGQERLLLNLLNGTPLQDS